MELSNMHAINACFFIYNLFTYHNPLKTILSRDEIADKNQASITVK